MFDIGFSKLLLIALVALVVLGPDRLPKLARTAGHLFGRLQRYVATVKADINREMQSSDLQKVKDEFQAAAKDIEQSVQASQTQIQESMRIIEADYAKPDTNMAAAKIGSATSVAPSADASLLEMHALNLPVDYLPPTAVADEKIESTLTSAGLQRFDLGLEPLRKVLNRIPNTPSNSVNDDSVHQLSSA
jgi:sec-independent protein translocase protein TatB